LGNPSISANNRPGIYAYQGHPGKLTFGSGSTPAALLGRLMKTWPHAYCWFSKQSRK